MTFFVFDTVVIGDDQTVERLVLFVSPQDDYVVLLDRSSPKAWPEIVSMSEAQESVETGLWTVRPGCPPDCVPDTNLSPKHRAKIDELWRLIEPIATQIPSVFFKMPRAALIRERLQTAETTRPTLTLNLLRWLHGGMSKAALVPRWSACGAPGMVRTPGEAKRGRPPSEGHPAGLNVTEEIRMIFLRAIDLTYARELRFTLAAAYSMAVRLMCDPIDDNGTIRLEPLEPFKAGFPTEDQFVYWAKRDNDMVALDRRRMTPRVWDQKFKPLLSSASSEAFGPCSRWQIDATILDIYARSRRRRHVIIGRPTLYIIVDVFSRMVVGIYIGLEPPSWVAAMMALSNAIEDKVDFCKRFDIKIAPEHWPTRHICGILEGDRGEIESAGILGLIERDRMTVETAAAYRGDWKGVVETRFRLLPAVFAPYVPGYVETDFCKRGARDYRLESALDIDEITKIIIECVLYFNNHHNLKKLDPYPGQIEAGVKPIPAELWEWGIATRSGLPREPNFEQYKFALMPRYTATMTPQGILHQGRLYKSSIALREGWYERARIKRFTVPISFDKRNVDHIYIHDSKAPCGFEVGELNVHSRTHEGLTFWESHDLQTERARLLAEGRDAQALARAELTAKIEAISDDAKAKLASDPPSGSDRQQIAGIRPARRAELEHDRRDEVDRFRPGRRPPSEPNSNVVPLRPDAAKVPSFGLSSLDVVEDDDDED